MRRFRTLIASLLTVLIGTAPLAAAEDLAKQESATQRAIAARMAIEREAEAQI